MARTTKAAPQAPSTMKELKDTLWKAADKLRGSMDASQYKDVILGLVFLKYVSDAFDERRDADPGRARAPTGIDEDQIAELIDDTDEYTGLRRVLGAAERALDVPRARTPRACRRRRTSRPRRSAS